MVLGLTPQAKNLPPLRGWLNPLGKNWQTVWIAGQSSHSESILESIADAVETGAEMRLFSSDTEPEVAVHAEGVAGQNEDALFGAQPVGQLARVDLEIVVHKRHPAGLWRHEPEHITIGGEPIEKNLEILKQH